MTARIREIRKRLRVSQAQMARALGCTQSNVGFYERGQTLPPDSAKRLVVFASELGLSLTLDQVYGLQPMPDMTAAEVVLMGGGR